MAAKKKSGKGEPHGDDLKEETFAISKSSKSDTLFDTTIGHIEDIIMEDEFQDMQTSFMDKYYTQFDEAEENRLIYTDIHKEYTELIESYLEKQLKQLMPSFNMLEFQKQLVSRQGELDGEVFEILLSFSDFLSFKEIILAYKAEKEGRALNLSSGLVISPLSPRGPPSSSLSSPPGVSQNGGGSASYAGGMGAASFQPVHVDMMMDCDYDDDGDSPRRMDDLVVPRRTEAGCASTNVSGVASNRSQGPVSGGASNRGGGASSNGGNIDLGLSLFGTGVRPPQNKKK